MMVGCCYKHLAAEELTISAAAQSVIMLHSLHGPITSKCLKY